MKTKIDLTFRPDNHDITSTLFTRTLSEQLITLINKGAPLQQLSIVSDCNADKNLNLINTSLGEIHNLHMVLDDLQTEYVTNSERMNDIEKQSLADEYASCHHKLMYLIGQYNYEVEHEDLLNRGLTSLKSAQKKSHKAFFKKYLNAIRLTEFILEDFYSDQANHPYPPILVIRHIERLCLENKISYPKDFNSDKFKSMLNPIINDIKKKFSIEQSWVGAQKTPYQTIPFNNFKQKFVHYIN
jgi:hypothetical protein